MFEIFFDRQHRVLLTRFSGTFTDEDIVAHDRAVVPVVASEGGMPGILDFTAVDTFAVTASRIAERGWRPQLVPGQIRIFVAPQPDVAALGRLFVNYQQTVGSTAPKIVDSLEEAFALVNLVDPQFEPLPQG